MSSGDNHRQTHTTPTARNICTCAVFATSSFNFGLPTYFVSHLLLPRDIICCVLLKSFFLSRAEPFDCGVANVISKVMLSCWCAWC